MLLIIIIIKIQIKIKKMNKYNKEIQVASGRHNFSQAVLENPAQMNNKSI